MTKYIVSVLILVGLVFTVWAVYLNLTREVPEVQSSVPQKMEPLPEYPCDPNCKG